MRTWKSKNRHKYLLQYHIIFVCKYRKKLLVSRQISDDIKQFSYEICQRHSVIIRYMEKISSIFAKTILERTYLLDRWIF
ncbi:MAG: transposase, partial [Agathobacter sp.]|nr:transposase [Lachnospiraceae bacterium]MDY2621164.1 transposase [Agathobacter sp.]